MIKHKFKAKLTKTTGAYYIGCGILLSVKGGILSFVVGLFTVGIGVLLVVSTKTGNQALRDMRTNNANFDDQQIAAKFLQFDRDSNGSLNASE